MLGAPRGLDEKAWPCCESLRPTRLGALWHTKHAAGDGTWRYFKIAARRVQVWRPSAQTAWPASAGQQGAGGSRLDALSEGLVTLSTIAAATS